MHGMTAYDVRWEASAKLFHVVLSFPLPEHPSTAQQLVSVLPAFIAERSRCSCGSSLVLGDHKVSIDGMHGSFQGSFLCSRCRESAGGALATLRRGFASFWRQIVRVKVGPTGLEFEKSADKPK
jgi:hypothetical protein